MKLFAYLAVGLMTVTTIAPATAQAQYRYHHRGYHHSDRWRHHDRRRHRRYWHRGRYWQSSRVVCRRYWYHHHRVRRCHRIWY